MDEVFGEISGLLRYGRAICLQGSALFRNGTFCSGDMVAALIEAVKAGAIPMLVRNN